MAAAGNPQAVPPPPAQEQQDPPAPAPPAAQAAVPVEPAAAPAEAVPPAQPVAEAERLKLELERMKTELLRQRQESEHKHRELMQKMESMQQHAMTSELRSLASSVVAISEEHVLKSQLVEAIDRMCQDIQMLCAHAATNPVFGGRAMVQNAQVLANFPTNLDWVSRGVYPQTEDPKDLASAAYLVQLIAFLLGCHPIYSSTMVQSTAITIDQTKPPSSSSAASAKASQRSALQELRKHVLQKMGWGGSTLQPLNNPIDAFIGIPLARVLSHLMMVRSALVEIERQAMACKRWFDSSRPDEATKFENAAKFAAEVGEVVQEFTNVYHQLLHLRTSTEAPGELAKIMSTLWYALGNDAQQAAPLVPRHGPFPRLQIERDANGIMSDVSTYYAKNKGHYVKSEEAYGVGTGTKAPSFAPTAFRVQAAPAPSFTRHVTMDSHTATSAQATAASPTGPNLPRPDPSLSQLESLLQLQNPKEYRFECCPAQLFASAEHQCKQGKELCAKWHVCFFCVRNGVRLEECVHPRFACPQSKGNRTFLRAPRAGDK